MMTLLKRLIDRFRDPIYRRSYVESFVDSYLATQIKVLREQRQLTQQQLANLADVKQSQLCRWENVNNTGWQLRSLKNLARALDLVLVVKFESFGNLMPDIESFGRNALQRPSFEDDPVFGRNVASVEVQINSSVEELVADPLLLVPPGDSWAPHGKVFDFGAYKRVA